MQTKSIIQSSANVIRITNLAKGNVYKRIEDSHYGDDSCKYGVVLDILNDGDKTFIESLEYTKNYNDIKANIKIFGGEKNISIFPVEVDEIEKHFESALANIKKSIEDKKEEILKLQKSLEDGQKFVSGEMAKELTVIQYKELPQGEYDNHKKAKKEALKELSF